MTNEFIVVGEHRDNEHELLVKGSDGEYYDFNLVHEGMSPVEPDENWVITESDESDLQAGLPETDPSLDVF